MRAYLKTVEPVRNPVVTNTLPFPFNIRNAMRVHGPYDPRHGLRHNPRKLLIDPYARAIAGRFEQVEDAVLLPPPSHNRQIDVACGYPATPQVFPQNRG